jgi:hypothetical protein
VSDGLVILMLHSLMIYSVHNLEPLNIALHILTIGNAAIQNARSFMNLAMKTKAILGKAFHLTISLQLQLGHNKGRGAQLGPDHCHVRPKCR